MTSTAISVRGNRTYVHAVKAFADTQGKSVADVVRTALDEKYGDELEPFISFFASAGSKNVQENAHTSNTQPNHNSNTENGGEANVTRIADELAVNS